MARSHGWLNIKGAQKRGVAPCDTQVVNVQLREWSCIRRHSDTGFFGSPNDPTKDVMTHSNVIPDGWNPVGFSRHKKSLGLRSLRLLRKSGKTLARRLWIDESLVLEVAEPRLREGLRFLLQAGVDVGLLAVGIMPVNLLKKTNVVVAEGNRLRHVRGGVGVEFKDHIRVAHQVAVLFSIVADRYQGVAFGGSADVLDREGHIARDGEADGVIVAEKLGKYESKVLIGFHDVVVFLVMKPPARGRRLRRCGTAGHAAFSAAVFWRTQR